MRFTSGLYMKFIVAHLKPPSSLLFFPIKFGFVVISVMWFELHSNY